MNLITTSISALVALGFVTAVQVAAPVAMAADSFSQQAQDASNQCVASMAADNQNTDFEMIAGQCGVDTAQVKTQLDALQAGVQLVDTTSESDENIQPADQDVDGCSVDVPAEVARALTKLTQADSLPDEQSVQAGEFEGQQCYSWSVGHVGDDGSVVPHKAYILVDGSVALVAGSSKFIVQQ